VDRPGLDSQGRSPLIKIRRVRKGDLSKVRDVIEQAFGDFFERQVGTRPRQVFGGAQYVHHRWLMEPWGCFVAEEGDGKIVGAAVAADHAPEREKAFRQRSRSICSMLVRPSRSRSITPRAAIRLPRG
jgi:hypothetical protein